MNQFEPSLVATDTAVRDSFLATLREVGTLAAAYRATGVAKATLNRLRRRDRDFDAACKAAIGRATTDCLEAALIERAIHGVEWIKIYPNGTTERRRVFDNTLAWKLLTKRMPLPYGDGTAAPPPPRPVMSREEFMAAIRMRPRLDEPEDDGDAGC